MYCKHCGAQLVDGARFCSNCCAPIDYNYQTGGMSSGSYTPIQRQQSNSNVCQVKPKKKHPIRNIFLVLFAFFMIIGSIDTEVQKGYSICCGGNLVEGTWDYNDNNFTYTERNGYEQEISMGGGECIKGYYLPSGEYRLSLVEAPLEFSIYQFVPPSDERYYAWSNSSIRYNLGEKAPDVRMFLEIVGNETQYSIWDTNGIWENNKANTYPKYVLSMQGNDKIRLEEYNLVVINKGKLRFIPY